MTYIDRDLWLMIVFTVIGFLALLITVIMLARRPQPRWFAPFMIVAAMMWGVLAGNTYTDYDRAVWYGGVMERICPLHQDDPTYGTESGWGINADCERHGYDMAGPTTPPPN